jgi:hypothetical protein
MGHLSGESDETVSRERLSLIGCCLGVLDCHFELLEDTSCLISLTAFAVVSPNLITTQIRGCLDVTSLLALRSFFSSPSYFGIGC